MTKTMTLSLLLGALLAGCTTPPAAPGPSASAMSPTGAPIVPGSEEDLAKNVGDRVFFDFDRAGLTGYSPLTARNTAVLDRQTAWLKTYGQNNVQVAGNCDERGTEEYNLALGQRRADTVRGYLLAKGIAPDRVSTISYGSERPAVTGSNEEAWRQDRNAITSLR